MAVRNLEEPTVIHAAGEITTANEAVCSPFGADSPTELVGQSVRNYVDTDKYETLQAQFEQLHEGTPTAVGLHTLLQSRSM